MSNDVMFPRSTRNGTDGSAVGSVVTALVRVKRLTLGLTGVLFVMTSGLTSVRAQDVADEKVMSAAMSAVVAPDDAAGNTLERIRHTGIVTVGYREGAFPFSFVDNRGKPVGFAIDMCRQMLKGLRSSLHMPSLELRYVPTTLIDRFNDLNRGKIDIECSSTANDAKGQAHFGFVLPYFVSSVQMLVPKNGPQIIRDYPDLLGKTVVINRNTPALRAFEERNRVRHLNATILVADDSADAFARLKRGEAAAWVMNDMLINGARVQDAQPNSYEMTGSVLVTSYVSAMVRRNDTGLRRALDNEMIMLMHGTGFAAIYNRWFVAPLPGTGPNGVSMNLPMSYALKELLRFPVSPMPY